jgi:hypothetical protein
VFASQAENKSELPLVLEAGKTYYLEQQVRMGILMARNKLVRLEEGPGRERLLKCSLSKDLAAEPPAAGASPGAAAPARVAPAAGPADSTAAPPDTSGAGEGGR